MDVILFQDVHKLGKIGDTVKVKDGYARNYLIPKGIAYLATSGNLKRLEQQKKQTAELHEKEKSEAQALADKMSKASCTINVEVNDLDKLYGAVNIADIVKVLSDEGFEVDRKDIEIEKPIEELGIFDIGVKVHPEVTAKVRLWVTKK